MNFLEWRKKSSLIASNSLTNSASESFDRTQYPFQLPISPACLKHIGLPPDVQSGNQPARRQRKDTSRSTIPRNLRLNPALYGVSSSRNLVLLLRGQPRMQAGMGKGSGRSPVGRAAVGLLLVVVVLPHKHFDGDRLAFHLIVVESVVPKLLQASESEKT